LLAVGTAEELELGDCVLEYGEDVPKFVPDAVADAEVELAEEAKMYPLTCTPRTCVSVV
jgi:hypothetical protein